MNDLSPLARAYALRAVLRRGVLPVLAFCLFALALTHPILGNFSTRFLGGDTSDAYEVARHIWWFRHALSAGEEVYYHSLLAYPDGFDPIKLRATPLNYFPMWLFAFVMPLPAAFNLGLLLMLTMNGTAMYALARRQISPESQAPALIAGLVYMTFPIFQGHLFEAHAGSLAAWAPPLLVMRLYAYVDGGRKRDFVWSTAFFALSALGHTLQVVYVLAPLMSLFILARLFRRDFVGATRALLVTAAGGFLLLLHLLPILNAQNALDAVDSVGGHVRYSIDLLGIVSPSFENPFWRDIATHSRRVLGINLGEGASYIGLAGGLLAAIGALRRRAALWWLLAAGVAWLLALGPVLKVLDQPLTPSIAGFSTVIPLPFALLMDLPFVDLARSPGRFMFFFALCFAMLAGYGAAALWSAPFFRRRKPWLLDGIGLALALLIFMDYQLFAHFPSVRAHVPAAIAALSQRDDIRAVYNLPHDNLLAAKEAMFLQTAHGKPLVAGQDTRVTPVDPARLSLLASFEPALLDDAGVDVVIINKARAAEMDILEAQYGRARESLGAPAYEDSRYAMFDVPRHAGDAMTGPAWSTATDNGSRAVYIFKDASGWLELQATLAAENRRVKFAFDGVDLGSREVIGSLPLRLPLPIARPGYHTFTIELDPPCPERFDARVLYCHGVSVSDIEIAQLSSGAIYDPIRIAGGIELSGYHLAEEPGDELAIHLWWSFDATRHEGEQRFIHVLDEQRRLMRQNDVSLGAAAAGSDHLESVRLDIGDFPPGDYVALTGWYSLPDMVRYDVLTDVDGAQDNTIALGRITVQD